MVHIDVTKEELPEIEVKGKYALFTDLRVEQGTVPAGMYCYALRHGDDDSFPCTVEEQVTVNYFGAVLLAEPLDFGGKKQIPVGYEDFAFTGERMNARQFMEKMVRMEKERCHAARSYSPDGPAVDRDGEKSMMGGRKR